MEIKKSFWRIGKEDNKKFNRIKLGRKTGVLTFLLGILFTAILVLPIAIFTFEAVELYWYNEKTMVIFLAIAWGLLMLCNGFSNYVTVKMAKAINRDMSDLQEVNEFAIFFYQSTNIGFGLFILAVLIFFGVSALS